MQMEEDLESLTIASFLKESTKKEFRLVGEC
jgi:hypothetical protein